MSQHKKIINLPSAEVTSRMFGPFDDNVTLIERAFAVVIRNRHGGAEGEDAISVEGNDARGVEQAAQVLETVRTVAKQGDAVPEQSVRYIIDMVRAGEQSALSDMSDDCICVTTRGKPIKAKTVGQRRYVNAIRKNTIIFGVGPAGTGKTFLAVAMAVKALRDKQVSRIILTRPAIEAGERLGFLPGDLQSKIDPYLRPLYDALFEMMGPENYQHCVEKQTIEVAPLAYMRGRTLDDSFIILDEAQNTTKEQMKMFLTRLGFGSKIVITGDVTQIDLPDDKVSGLKDAIRVLEGVKDIAICKLTSADVVRHALVQEIINAYEKAAHRQEIRKPAQTFKGSYQRKKYEN